MNLNQVTLTSSDLEQTKVFYRKLGFELIVDTPHYLRFVCSQGDSTFSFVYSNKVLNSTTIYFEHEALDEKVNYLITKGIEFLQMPSDKDYLWREAVLIDPSGNKIKLYWAGENRLNPPWKVSKLNE